MQEGSFREARQGASKLIDKLGRPIDPGILDTVTALRMLGVNTTSSCEGHAGRFTGGPYVLFASSELGELREKYREHTDRTSAEYKDWFRQASALNMREVQKVLELLDGFYAERMTPHSQRLIVRCFGPTPAKLMCQDADLAHIVGKDEQRDILLRNQHEMDAFTSYLLEKVS
jgi:hypothetical protein